MSTVQICLIESIYCRFEECLPESKFRYYDVTQSNTESTTPHISFINPQTCPLIYKVPQYTDDKSIIIADMQSAVGTEMIGLYKTTFYGDDAGIMETIHC